MAELANTRVAVTEALIELADRDPRVVLIVADTVGVLKALPFKEKHPDRIIDVGIAEQGLVACASGLASSGMLPFAATYGVFITMRACEQVRSFVGYPKLNVKMIGANGGMGAGEREGVTHQALEDIGILRMVPGMTIVVPADAGQTKKAVFAVAEIPGPAYIRIGSGRDPVVFDEDEPFELGKARVLRRNGADVAVFSNGFILPRAITAVEELDRRGIGATLVEVHTVKPLDEELILDTLRNCKAAVVVEDHFTIGGLGSAIAECASEHQPVPVIRLGLQDVFPESGDPDPLYDKYGLSVDDIVEAAIRAKSLRRTA